MIVTKLLAVIQAIRHEYSHTNILKLLDRARKISAERNGLTNSEYANAITTLKIDAENVSQRNILANFSSELSKHILDTGYERLLPQNLAKTIINGMSLDKNESMSSAEFGLLYNSATQFNSRLEVTEDVINRFTSEGNPIPEGRISLDFVVPRSAFGNKVVDYTKINLAFLDIAKYIEELSSEDSTGPELVYTSTSDPVTGIAVVTAAVMPMIIF